MINTPIPFVWGAPPDGGLGTQACNLESATGGLSCSSPKARTPHVAPARGMFLRDACMSARSSDILATRGARPRTPPTSVLRGGASARACTQQDKHRGNTHRQNVTTLCATPFFKNKEYCTIDTFPGPTYDQPSLLPCISACERRLKEKTS